MTVPISRLTDTTIFGAYLLQFLYGALPTIKLPLLSMATHERHRSSLLGPVAITLTVASLNATTEYFSPRYMPTDFPLLLLFFISTRHFVPINVHFFLSHLDNLIHPERNLYTWDHSTFLTAATLLLHSVSCLLKHMLCAS